jgi:DnaK suppressor protein
MDLLVTASSPPLSLNSMAAWHNKAMTEGEKMSDLREQLQQELHSIEAIAEAADAAAGTVELDQTRMGRLSRMDAMQGQAMVQATIARRQARVVLIKAALARIERGEFGACQSCAEAIAWPRLQINPAATLCFDCAEQAGD